jgi:hypothetical protein
MILPDAVRASATPNARDRHTASEGGELATIPDESTVVGAGTSSRDTAGVDKEGLDVRGSTREELGSTESGTYDHRRIVTRTITPTSIVRSRHRRTEQHVSDF